MRHLVAVSAAVLLVAPSLWAKDKPAVPSAEMQAMMQKATEYGTPGAEHKRLDPLVGKFNAVAKMWMKAGDKPMESKGQAENSWILGGRYLKQEYKGEFSGQPFEGLGFVAYDKVRQEYESIWMDSMMTGIMLTTGGFDSATQAVKQSGNVSCPMTGDKALWMRTEYKIKDANSHTYSSFGKGPDGKEFKTMEITYNRIP